MTPFQRMQMILSFVAEPPDSAQCFDFCFVSGVKWQTHVSSILTIRRKKLVDFFVKRSKLFAINQYLTYAAPT